MATENVLFGLILNINGVEVAISANPKKAAEEGMTFNLDAEDKDLGTISELIDWFNTNFGVNIPKGDDLPYPLGDAIGKIETLNFTINKLKMDLPTKGNKQYDFKFSAAWPEGQAQTIVGQLALQGGSFSATNINEDGTGGDV